MATEEEESDNNNTVGLERCFLLIMSAKLQTDIYQSNILFLCSVTSRNVDMGCGSALRMFILPTREIF